MTCCGKLQYLLLMSSASKNITQKLLPAFKVNLLEYTFFPEKSQDDFVVMEILPEMK